MMMSGGGGAVAIALLMFTVVPALLFLACWYAGDVFAFIVDTIRRRDFLAESERQRRLDGRLFDDRRNSRIPFDADSKDSR
ncbi:hypothetical protein [Stieleria mannarensis]|uniref:hypothetical protein n=1 Tax=Stieleria mannarensis TaxID=2755585 RepID=UPI001604821D|nr:hypothetical protein [Rhodopirellula sp. JC639]